MDSLTLIRPIVVKLRVTEEYKRAAAAEIQEAIRHLDLELSHLEFQEKRLAQEAEKADKNPAVLAARHRLGEEKNKKTEARQKLLDKLKEIGRVEPGTELAFARMEGPVQLKVGDDWASVLGVEIIVQDGVVVEIRQRGAAGGGG